MSLPTAPPTQPRYAEETELLLTLLRNRDHDCPRCGYNLRNLTQPVCPECREELVLKVGTSRLRLWWLLLTLAPGMFCAIVIGILCVGTLRWGPPGFQSEDWLLVGFLAASGALGVTLAFYHRRFLRISYESQIIWAACVWGVHVLMLMVVFLR